ncbi:multicopper oxidase domain-containing protein [Streptomyces sp. 4N509B]|uniref:multicopper oxidase domain-containing protein n=1 Tax=Streptomyces sp. 4N509B TaxID=3457413 RepID=UPI003FD1A07A
MTPNRRTFLKVTAVGGAAAMLPATQAAADDAAGAAADAGTNDPTGHAGHHGHHQTAAEGDEPPPPATSAPFALAMPVPPVLQPRRSTLWSDTYTLAMRQVRRELVAGLSTPVRTYGGTFPGPTIRAFRGRETIVHHHNGLDVNAAVHLHGGHVPSEHDGLPMDVVAPGTSRTYRYPNSQVAAPLWYHDHAHHVEAENVYRGMYGAYILSDTRESLLPLPGGAYDVPLMFQDARVEQDGTLSLSRPDLCPHMLVNGKERPYFEVAARSYRLRLYNTSIGRYVSLRFADGATFQQIASDGGLLAEPLERDEIRLGAGERAEIVVDFSRYRVGESIVLENTAAAPTERPEVLRLDVVRHAFDPTWVPRRLANVPPARPSRRAVERDFTLTLIPAPQINGKQYDPERADVVTTVGTEEIWTITNGDPQLPPPDFMVHHTFHTHLVQFRVLERNGAPVGPEESGWKDTVGLAPGESVRIAMTWGDYPGEYVYHCHQLGHSAEGQMGRIDVRAR